jgi:lysozyme
MTLSNEAKQRATDSELEAAGIVRLPFIVVPPGEQPPTAWLAAHPGAIKIPGGFVVRGDAAAPDGLPFDLAAVLDMLAVNALADQGGVAPPGSSSSPMESHPWPSAYKSSAAPIVRPSGARRAVNNNGPMQMAAASGAAAATAPEVSSAAPSGSVEPAAHTPRHAGTDGKTASTTANPNAALKLSDAGARFITSWEQLKPAVYIVANQKLIGYGHAWSPDEAETIDKTQAMTYFKKDISTAEDLVKRTMKVSLTQQQFDALVSLAFNLSLPSFVNSPVVLEINANHLQNAENIWLSYKVPLPGLKPRRAGEVSIFANGNYSMHQ